MIDESGLRSALRANVPRLRRAKGMSQEALAKEIGISRIQLSRLENGKHTPGADALFSLADALGVPADCLRQVSG